jgi:hypothetical protein
MDECIAERPKLLISLKNTYKQKKKLEWDGDGRSGGVDVVCFK